MIYDWNHDCIAKCCAMNILRKANSFDKSVYNCAHYQLLRMPGCVKPNDIKSKKKLIFPSNLNLTFKEELKINQCDNKLKVNQFDNELKNVDYCLSDKIPQPKNSINCVNEEQLMVLTIIKNNMSENCVCVNSNNGLIVYRFTSKINELKWKEKRCMQCKLIKVIDSNSSIKYPRQYCNLPLDIKEIEEIDSIINKFKMKIKNDNTYAFIFKDKEFRKYFDADIKYSVPFTKYVIATCGHNPNTFYVKSSKNKYIKIDGRFAYFCSHCNKYFNSNYFCGI